MRKTTKSKIKLMDLKEWLTIPETAKYLSNPMKEEVSETDIFRLLLDGHLKLSVKFVNMAYAMRGKIVSKEEVEYSESELSPLLTAARKSCKS